MAESENVIDLKEVKEKRESAAFVQEMLSTPRIEPNLDFSKNNIVLSWSAFGDEKVTNLHVVIHHNPGAGIPCTTVGAFSCTAEQWKQFVTEGSAILEAHSKVFAKELPAGEKDA